ncbi:MAG TPA: NAD(P)H-quinone oxidoreductase [Thermoanaerobaculia bacterium]|nr:NAD(P)H-quinone oxidoreductase [Thermoanaerobaculia bacterium]
MPATSARTHVVICDGFGGPEVLKIVEAPRPVPGPDELLVRVRAAALNNADLLQRDGSYSPPPGESEILGVEIAGEVEEMGERVSGFQRGQRVFGLVGSGGYAEHCLLDAGMAIPVPDGWSWTEAAAVPEAYFTADTTLFELGGLAAGQSVLIHAAGSGIGTVCIQLARFTGARVLCTAGSDEKLARCRELGADAGFNYKTEDWAAEVLRATGDAGDTGGAGVDVVWDVVGATYLARNLAVLRDGGRLVQVGLLTGWETEIDLLPLVLRRLQIKGSSMRPRSLADKRAITRKFRERWLPLLEERRLRPVIDSVFPLERVAEAHARMEAHLNFGKILLTID